jgi:Flp pilus assembly protein TadD
MEKLTIHYCSYAKALPPQAIRIAPGGWSGSSEKMEDGSQPQPWHCLPYVEGATYGLELIYQFDTECQVVNDNGTVHFDWDFTREPGGVLSGGEFAAFEPRYASKFYLFNTRLDLQPPAGHVLRTEPHPRFFTDDTGTVPLAMVGHLQNEWYPRQPFVVFRAPRPGQRHIFRKGEAYAQLLAVPQRVSYEAVPMDKEQEARRRELERSIRAAKDQIADNSWRSPDGAEFNNHYKMLARVFARDGVAGVEAAVQAALKRHEQSMPGDRPIAECLALGAKHLGEHQYEKARDIFTHVLTREPDNANALSHLGICLACLGTIPNGLQMMARAVALEPRIAKYHSNLGEILRLLGRLSEAEERFRASLQLNPNDCGVMSVLGLTLAQQGRSAEGMQLCRVAAAMNPALPAVQYRLGLILAQEGRFDEARACYEAALAIDANYGEARRALLELHA